MTRPPAATISSIGSISATVNQKKAKGKRQRAKGKSAERCNRSESEYQGNRLPDLVIFAFCLLFGLGCWRMSESKTGFEYNSPGQEPAIRVVLMPKDTNAHGTIFGGVILSYIDIAAAIEVRRHTLKKIVTKAMHEIVFVAPVFVGDLVSFYTELVRIGRTSITVKVTGEADRVASPGQRVRVTAAEVVSVAIDDDRRPVPIRDEA